MTAVIETQLTAALRRAAIRATYAPSVHNTQPWRFDLRHGELDVVADRSRQLAILDPTGRQLTISLGCAVFNARVAVAGARLTPVTRRFPFGVGAPIVARLSAAESSPEIDPIASYDDVIEERQTNRRRFVDERVPAEVVSALIDVAAAEGAVLHPVRTEDDRITLARLTQRAEQIQVADPAYLAELGRWTSADPRRLDGVPAAAVPHAGEAHHDDIPLRDFDTTGRGQLPGETHSSIRQCLLLLGTVADEPESWLRAGEALERVLLEVTRRGFAASPLTQAIEVGAIRAELRSALGIDWWPHVLLRVGRAPLAPASRRRRLVEVLHETL